jgi:hypothetical protein
VALWNDPEELEPAPRQLQNAFQSEWARFEHANEPCLQAQMPQEGHHEQRFGQERAGFGVWGSRVGVWGLGFRQNARWDWLRTMVKDGGEIFEFGKEGADICRFGAPRQRQRQR